MSKKTESPLEQDGYILAHTNMDGAETEQAYINQERVMVDITEEQGLRDLCDWMIRQNLFVDDVLRIKEDYPRYLEFKQAFDAATEPSRQAFINMIDTGGVPTNVELEMLANMRKGNLDAVNMACAHYTAASGQNISYKVGDASDIMASMTDKEIEMIRAVRASEAVVIPFDDVVTADNGPAPVMYLGPDGFSKLLGEQQHWSLNTFGPAPRTAGVLDHITKEVSEVRAEPYDLMEWIDLCVLAIDGFWRHGGNPSMFVTLYERKLRKNFARVWPDWRKLSEDQAIEHDRSHD